MLDHDIVLVHKITTKGIDMPEIDIKALRGNVLSFGVLVQNNLAEMVGIIEKQAARIAELEKQAPKADEPKAA